MRTMAEFQNSQSINTVKVSILPTGWLILPDTWIFSDGKPGVKHWSPDYSFLVRHPSGKNLLFDLGMRKDLENNPLAIQSDYHIISPHVPRDAYDLLLEGPVHPEQIDAVILSHLHFDHTGDVTRFPGAEILVGAGSYAAAAPGWPEATMSPFDGTVFKHSKFRELPDSDPRFVSIGPFPKAYDFFGDGSFYLIDTPGHMPGHQMGFAKTGDDEWVIMGGDCCHHRELVTSQTRTISVTDGPGGQPGFHKYPDLAVSSIAKLRAMKEYKNVLIILAHDASLQEKVPMYPYNVNDWLRREGSQGKL
ncbi:beta-lactamase-like protein [Xylogone sp. PMI_703]|nr:beta-lactamase-like protein [Xylogone sp. PMI_703]